LPSPLGVKEMVKNRKDFKLGVGFTAFCLFCLIYLIPRHVGGLTEPESLMPVIVVLFILVLGLSLTFNSLRVEEENKEEHQAGDNKNPVTILTVIVIMVALAWLMDYLGFIMSSFLAMIILFFIFGVRSYWRMFIITSITLAVLYVAFEKLLIAPLPVGTLIESLM